MNECNRPSTAQRRVYVYRGTIPSLLGILLVIPVLLAFVSLFAVLLGGAALGALLVPLLARRRGRRIARDGDAIELSPDQYSRIEPSGPHRRSPAD